VRKLLQKKLKAIENSLDQGLDDLSGELGRLLDESELSESQITECLTQVADPRLIDREPTDKPLRASLVERLSKLERADGDLDVEAAADAFIGIRDEFCALVSKRHRFSAPSRTLT